MAFTMAAIICVGVFGGIKIDQKRGSEVPIFTIIGAILGVALAMYYTIKDLLKK